VYRLSGCAVVAAAIALAAGAAALSSPQSVPPGTFTGCPRGTLPLPGSPSAYETPARKVVLSFVHTTYAQRSRTHRFGLKDAGARADRVTLVRHWLPGGWVKSECGATVWARSFAVHIYFPAMDPPHNPVGHCNACARITFLISRTRRGWLVWGNY
jgi:hypothetical protein